MYFELKLSIYRYGKFRLITQHNSLGLFPLSSVVLWYRLWSLLSYLGEQGWCVLWSTPNQGCWFGMFRWDHLGSQVTGDVQSFIFRLPALIYLSSTHSSSSTSGSVVSRAVENALVLTSILCVSILSVFVIKVIEATFFCLNINR